MTINSRRFCGLLGLLAAFTAMAAAPPPKAPSRAQPENLTHWPWYHEVKLPANIEPGTRVDFVVPPAVFGRANLELGDLRLIDGAGKTVPYALRVRSPQNEQRPLPQQRTFNQGTNDDHSVAVSVDLGENPQQHNEIEVNLAGSGYGRPLRLEGSADDKTWSKLLDGVYVVHLDVAGKRIDQKRFSYPPSRFRYLRVHIRPDRVIEDDRPQLLSVQVYHSVHVPGESITLPATLGAREPGRLYSEYASSWVIDLGERNVPCERLSLDVEEPDFSRSYNLELFNPSEPAMMIQGGELRRVPGERSPIEIALQRPVTAHKLRLTIQDSRNPPLTITGVRFTAAVREVVFVVPSGLKAPLRLYHGNPKAFAPNYDFAASLPQRLDPTPLRVELSGPEKNPQYVPPPKPWTERWPWLVDAVLAVACVVLLCILVVLGRNAIRKHDMAQVTT
jgi:hypothetical protein